MILDSCFVIALQREAKRGQAGPALRFLERHSKDRFQISFTIAGELACGDSVAQRAEWERLLRPFHVLPWSMDIAYRYGELFRTLKKKGMLIGANDLWIAATALEHQEVLVTDNQADFGRIPGLVWMPFTDRP